MITIKTLWEAMPRELQRKTSLHTLKQTVDAYKATHGWQPIETAPKEGVFVVFVPHSDVGYQCMATYNTADRLLDIMSFEDLTSHATHWMPQPESPENVLGDGSPDTNTQQTR